jgi:hypothetical protein
MNELVTRGATLDVEMAAQGYRAGTHPAQLINSATEGFVSDADLCAQHTCGCGHHGMTYRAYLGPGGGYRGFTVCPACDVAREF